MKKQPLNQYNSLYKRSLAIMLCMSILVLACGCGKSCPKISYTSFSTTGFDIISDDGKNTATDIFFSSYLSTLFSIAFILEVNADSEDYDIAKLKGNEVYVAVHINDNRIDVYAPYDGNQIIGAQYWPDKSKAQIGTVETDYSVDSYLSMLKEEGIIDDFVATPAEAINAVADEAFD